MFYASLLLPLLLFLRAAAHKEPKTPEEIEVQRALQAAAYHCAPAVEEFTAARKRSWAQKVLSGNPSLPGYDQLFEDGTYADVAPGTIKDLESKKGSKGKILSCVEASQTKIRNNTCVLGPLASSQNVVSLVSDF